MSDFINKHRLLSLFLCIFFCTAFSIGIFCTRTLPHVDEVWSYMLSNKTDSPFLYAPAIGVGEEDFDTSNLVLSETESYKMYFNQKAGKTLLNLDPGQFIPGLDIAMMYREMYWASEGYLWEMVQQDNVDMEKMEKDFEKLIAFWKSVYLRKE